MTEAVPNRALNSNHTIKSLKAKTHTDCKLDCIENFGCLSINFVKRQGQDADCELNDSEDSQHPEDMEDRENTTFYATEVSP